MTDEDGTYVAGSKSIVVANAAPVAMRRRPDQAGVEGVPTTFDLGSFSDVPGDGPWTVRVEWGDGSKRIVQRRVGRRDRLARAIFMRFREITPSPSSASTRTPRRPHGDFNAAIADIGPTLSPPSPQSATEGSAASIDLGSLADLDPLGRPVVGPRRLGRRRPASTATLDPNLLGGAIALEGAAWAKSDSVVVATSPPPDGSRTADKLIAYTISAQHFALQQMAKPGCRRAMSFRFSQGGRPCLGGGLPQRRAGRGTLNGALGQFESRNRDGHIQANLRQRLHGRCGGLRRPRRGLVHAALTATTSAATGLRAYVFPNSDAFFAGGGSGGVYCGVRT